MPFKGEPRKCKYCHLEAKKNIIKGRNKGWLRTCGSTKCLKKQYKLTSINKKKKVYCERICKLCNKKYKAVGTQKWCKVCVPDKIWRRRVQRYNISKPDWNELFIKQGGKCALCKNEPTVVDHCHTNGYVRGLLCSSCNFLIAAIDKPSFMNKAIKYIKEAYNANEKSKTKSIFVG